MKTPLSEAAYAKINLALHVRQRRADGYHEIETIFAFAEDGDLVSAEAADGLSLEIAGPFAEGLTADIDNLVLRAARGLQAAFGIDRGARLRLEKNLPIASGIGGGSADAAATLRLLARLWGIEPDAHQLVQIARSLGADVPACLASEPLVGTGRGDDLQPFSGIDSGTPLLLINPRKPLSTGAVFAGWDERDGGPLKLRDPFSWRNDLTLPAISLVPEIGEVLAKLALLEGVTRARMSGSGATCFAMFENDAARDAAALQFPGMWVMPTRLR